MKLSAYILAADPAWVELSVLSYYDLVNEIICSYDEGRRGWSGQPVEVEECLKRVQAIDRAGKVRLAPGNYSQFHDDPMKGDTYQRNCALDQASRDADWVLQLDTDEVLADPAVFQTCLRHADAKGFAAMDFPARLLYRQLGAHRYLETCSRFWRTTGNYPGPVAVKAHTRLRYARQCDVPAYRVDFRRKNTSPWLPKDAAVHEAISVDGGIYHFSWVRSEEQMRAKSHSSGHVKEVNWQRELEHWAWSGRHPYVTMLRTPFIRIRNGSPRHFRVASIPVTRFAQNGIAEYIEH